MCWRCQDVIDIDLIADFIFTSVFTHWGLEDGYRLVRFGFFVKWHINLCELSNAKAILVEQQWWYYLIHTWKDEWIHTFPK